MSIWIFTGKYRRPGHTGPLEQRLLNEAREMYLRNQTEKQSLLYVAVSLTVAGDCEMIRSTMSLPLTGPGHSQHPLHNFVFEVLLIHVEDSLNSFDLETSHVSEKWVDHTRFRLITSIIAITIPDGRPINAQGTDGWPSSHSDFII